MSILSRIWRRLHVSAAANQRKRRLIALRAAGSEARPCLADKWNDADVEEAIYNLQLRTQMRAATHNDRVVGVYYLN